MREIKFRVWHRKEKKLYFRGYQKLSHILLCEDDYGRNEGKGFPLKRASYEDCELLESTGLFDKNGREIFEGDIVKIRVSDGEFRGTVGPIPDMFRSRRLHPLHDLLRSYGVADDEELLETEVMGNRYGVPEAGASGVKVQRQEHR